MKSGFVAILGMPNVGKSTIFNIITNLTQKDNGNVYIDGKIKDLSNTTPDILELYEMLIKCAKEKVSMYLGEYNDQKRIDELLVDKSDLQEFLGDSSRVLNVEFLALAIGDVEPEDGCRNEELKVKVQSILSDKLKGYSNPNFMSEYQKHNYPN